jgi:hypothetical protein
MPGTDLSTFHKKTDDKILRQDKFLMQGAYLPYESKQPLEHFIAQYPVVVKLLSTNPRDFEAKP